MGLFGKSKPRELKALEQEVLAARVALNLYDKLPAAKQQNALIVAERDIKATAQQAKAAGHGDGARQYLTEAKAKPVTSSVKDRWPEFIDSALAAL